MFCSNSGSIKGNITDVEAFVDFAKVITGFVISINGEEKRSLGDTHSKWTLSQGV
jgi:hypothetical protein